MSIINMPNQIYWGNNVRNLSIIFHWRMGYFNNHYDTKHGSNKIP